MGNVFEEKNRPFGRIKQEYREYLSLASHRSRDGRFRNTNTDGGSAGNDRYGCGLQTREIDVVTLARVAGYAR